MTLIDTIISVLIHRVSSRRVCGFTLIELVVSLVIIGALAAISAPIFFTQQTFAERGFMNETRAAMRYAQKLAVASGCSVQVQFTGNGFSLARSGNLANCNDGAYTQPVTDPSNLGSQFSRTAPASVTIAAIPSTFVFEPLGGVSGGGGVAVNLSGGLSFGIVGATGYVQ